MGTNFKLTYKELQIFYCDLNFEYWVSTGSTDKEKTKKKINYNRNFDTTDSAEKSGGWGWNMVERGDINSISPELVHLFTMSNHVMTSNQIQNLGITCKKTNNWNSSALSWEDLGFSYIPVHNHDQSSNVCVGTLEICGGCDHESSNLVHPATRNGNMLRKKNNCWERTFMYWNTRKQIHLH